MATQDTQQNTFQQIGGRVQSAPGQNPGQNNIFQATPEQMIEFQKTGNILRQGINTNTPSGAQFGNAQAPAVAQANPAQGNPIGGFNPDGTPNYNTQNDLASKYNQTLQNLQSSGRAPQTPGAASQAIQQAAPLPTPPPYNPAKADAVMADDQTHQKYITDFNVAQTSAAKNETLTAEYTRLTSAAGVSTMDTKLLNMKAIMEGTEQDIRNEITKAGGFATESQIQAMSVARNKTMITNYSNLLQTRNDAVANVNTQIGLSEQDKAYATQQIDRQLNFDQQQIQFADKALVNAQDSLKGMQSSEGWDGIYRAAVATGDPTAIAKINSTMGAGFDLYTMAQQDAQTRTAQQQTNQLAAQEKQTTIAKNQADINKINADTQKAQADALARPAKDAADLAYKQAQTANLGVDNARADKQLQETIAHNQATEAETHAKNIVDAQNIKDDNKRADTIAAETTRHHEAEEAIARQKITSDLVNTPGTPQYTKHQDSLEKQSEPIVEKTMSNRSGGLGFQDAKVNQAIHLSTLMNQFKDSKGNFNIPKSQYTELTLGLATLISPTNNVGIELQREISQRTAKGDFGGALTYLTGTPFNGTTNDVAKLLAASIDRQGQVSSQLRDTYTNNLGNILPTGLEQTRVDKLKNSLQLNKYEPILGSSSGISVTDPSGGIHSFPDQKSADAFKKAAGIK